ncbi:hypothetical protein pipiens_001054 [Culex pipiens pipiens]|uniref:Uncharacterized protein n=1 Tax=Culex pipiens pipiens TaxID=38569 RepID=A0ABD1D318_CULPP
MMRQEKPDTGRSFRCHRRNRNKFHLTNTKPDPNNDRSRFWIRNRQCSVLANQLTRTDEKLQRIEAIAKDGEFVYNQKLQFLDEESESYPQKEILAPRPLQPDDHMLTVRVPRLDTPERSPKQK